MKLIINKSFVLDKPSQPEVVTAPLTPEIVPTAAETSTTTATSTVVPMTTATGNFFLKTIFFSKIHDFETNKINSIFKRVLNLCAY